MNSENKNKQEQEALQEYWSYLSNNNNANIGNLKDRIKEDKEIVKNDEEKYTSGFTILGHISVVLSIISLIIICIFTPSFSTIFTYILSSILSISCIYGLGGARERICYLEDEIEDLIKDNKNIKNQIKHIRSELNNKVDSRDIKE